jgi:hypothetical protein
MQYAHSKDWEKPWERTVLLMAKLRRMELMMLRVLMGSGMEKTRSLFSRTGELPYPRRRVMKTKSLSNRSDPLDVLIFPLQRDATRRAVSLSAAIKECAMPSHLAGHFPAQHEPFPTHERRPHHHKQ